MKKICFHVIKYYPSLGGTELLAKQIIDSFANNDLDLTVKTTPEQGRVFSDFNYKIDESVFTRPEEKYDLSIFFSDLWSPQLNKYNLSTSKKNICILNLDEITYGWRDRLGAAINNLKKFDLVLTFSKNGIANKFLKEEGIKNSYIANFSRDILSTESLFNLRDKLKINNNPIGLYCAAFDQRKNQLYFLENLKKSNRLKQYNWIFIGNPSDVQYQKKCISFVKENKLENIFFVQSTSDQQKINTIFQQVDFVTLLSTAEGMPLTILEALSANKPVVSTPVGGTAGVLSDLIGDGVLLTDKIIYDLTDFENKVQSCLGYKGNSLREIWLKNHNKNDILEKYKKIFIEHL